MKSLTFTLIVIFLAVGVIRTHAQDSLNVTMVGSLNDYWDEACGVTLSGNIAYVADGGVGMRVVDISSPTSPMEIGYYDTPGNTRAVAISGSHAYLADQDDGLRVVNITDPAHPVEIGYYDTPGYAVSVAISGNYACVADVDSGLRIISVADPAHPQEVGHYHTPECCLWRGSVRQLCFYCGW